MPSFFYYKKGYMKINRFHTCGLIVALVLKLNGLLAQTTPNLLILHTDEHNFRTLGCYRETIDSAQAYLWGTTEMATTPNIDRLADNGILCTSFYANSPVCSPSRSSFVSGLYPPLDGIAGRRSSPCIPSIL